MNLDNLHMAGPSVTEEDISIVVDMLRNGWYGKNAYTYVEKFEHEFATLHSRKYGLMTPNCTSAIHLLLSALNISEEDEVCVPEITWIASAAPIVYQRAKPVFVDVREDTWCIDENDLLKKINDKTRALIAVNVYGGMPNYEKLQQICDERKIILIEDSAESLGSTFKSVKSGKFGSASVFSFHRTKTLTTGEGGMLLTDDKELYERCKFLRDHGRAPGTYYNTEVTFKYMPSNLSAALGYAQLQRLDKLIKKKREIFEIYQENFENTQGIQLNPKIQDVFNSVWSTVLLFDKNFNFRAEKVMRQLEIKGIPTRPFFYPLSSLPAFENYVGSRSEPRNEISFDISKRGMCLPSALIIERSEINWISDQIKNVIREISSNG